MWKRIKAAKWGEIALWTGFVVFGLVGSSAGMEAITLSGLCALAAVGRLAGAVRGQRIATGATPRRKVRYSSLLRVMPRNWACGVPRVSMMA